jgi:hypothetical protein
MTNLNAAQVKKIAKELTIKNWWTKKRADLVIEIAAIKGWAAESAETIEFLLSGGTITQCEAAPIPAPKHTKEDQAFQVTEKPAKKRRKPSTKKPTDKKPAKVKLVKSEVEGISLANLCTELSVEPRIARRKLRNAKFVKPATGWFFPTDEIQSVKDLLTK